MQTGQLQAMKGLIETAVKGNGGQGAVLVAHSMGNLVALHLLNDQKPGWIKDNIAGLVTINAPLLGAVTALKGVPAWWSASWSVPGSLRTAMALEGLLLCARLMQSHALPFPPSNHGGRPYSAVDETWVAVAHVEDLLLIEHPTLRELLRAGGDALSCMKHPGWGRHACD